MHKAVVTLLVMLAYAGVSHAKQCGADLNGSGAIDESGEMQQCDEYPGGEVCPIEQQACDREVDGSYSCPSDPDAACVEASAQGKEIRACSFERRVILTESSSGSGQNAITLLSRTGGATQECGDNCVRYRVQATGQGSIGGCTPAGGSQRFRVNDPSSIERVILGSQNHYATGFTRIDDNEVYRSPNQSCSGSGYAGIQYPGTDITHYFRSAGATVEHSAVALYTDYGGVDSAIEFHFKSASCEVESEYFTNGCDANENDSSCRIKNEWKDGTQTIRDFQSTGNQPSPSTRTINNNGCSADVTRDYWEVEREYECDDPDSPLEMVCSPHQCFDDGGEGKEDIPDPNDPMAEDNGDKDEFGKCLDELRFFPGESKRCRTSGVQTSYQNCCRNDLGRLDDTTGKSGGQNQVEYREEHSSVEFWKNQCDPEDQETALLDDSGYCMYVGETCREKWKFVGCVQEQKIYCCFNSKLSRIIHQQGRPQLKTFDGYGSPSARNCRGFTPEEFQSLDFSKIDMSEYYGAMVHRSQSQMEQKARENAESKY